MTVNIARATVTQTTLEIKEPLEIGQDVVLQAKGEVISQNTVNNHDGTVNLTSKVKLSFVDIQKTDGEKVSQGLIVEKSIRSMCVAVALELGESPEGLYHLVKEKATEFLNRYKETKMGL